MSDVKLLPCPFCGVEPYTALSYIGCANDDCRTVVRSNTQAAWNARPAPALTPKQEAADEMFDALEECKEYFEARADADHNGERFVANAEMVMEATVTAALAKAGRA